jgi:hypothetical protein
LQKSITGQKPRLLGKLEGRTRIQQNKTKETLLCLLPTVIDLKQMRKGVVQLRNTLAVGVATYTSLSLYDAIAHADIHTDLRNNLLDRRVIVGSGSDLKDSTSSNDNTVFKPDNLDYDDCSSSLSGSERNDDVLSQIVHEEDSSVVDMSDSSARIEEPRFRVNYSAPVNNSVASSTLSIISGDSMFARSCEILGTSLANLSHINDVSPTEAEIRGTQKAFEARPDMLRRILSPHKFFKDLDLDASLLDSASDLLRKPDFIDDVRALIRNEEDSDTSSRYLDQPAFYIQGGREEKNRSCLQYSEWELLKEKYPCVICQDVLSAPHLLNCSHTFCFDCVTEYMTRAVSKDAEVSHCCPSCNDEIKTWTYERLLDDDICQRVNNVSIADAERSDWRERREKFNVHVRKNKNSKFFGKMEETENAYDWLQVGTVFVAVAMIVVIAIARSR